MNQIDKILLEFIKGGIHNDYSPQGVFDNIDWGNFLKKAYNQVVMAVAWDGFSKSEIKTIPLEIKLKWFGNVIKSYEERYKKYEKSIASLANFYNSHQIKMLILKGYGLSLNYPNPQHRPCGDIDIYLFDKQQEGDELIAKEKGIKIEREHLLHTVFFYEGEMIENHYDFISDDAHKSNSKIGEWLNNLIKEECEKINVEEEEIYLPSPNFNALYLLHHTAKHFAGEQVMLRHILDWATFVEKYTHKVDWKKIYDIARSNNLELFLNCLNEICVRYLGYNKEIFDPIFSQRNSKEICQTEKYYDKILEEILNPSVSIFKPKGKIQNIVFRIYRWLSFRWKRKMIYNEGFIESLKRRVHK